MTFHIVIKEERRLPVVTEFGIDKSRLAIDIDGQLHTNSTADMGKVDWKDAQFVMVVEWDMKSPFVNEIKGDYAKRTMEYFGWPQITEKEYVPPDPL